MALAPRARGTVSSIKCVFGFPSQIKSISNQTGSNANICGGGRTTIPRSAVGSIDQIPPAGTVSFADDDALNRSRRTAATTADNVELMGADKLGTLPQIHGELYLFLAPEPAESNAYVNTTISKR